MKRSIWYTVMVMVVLVSCNDAKTPGKKGSSGESMRISSEEKKYHIDTDYFEDRDSTSFAFYYGKNLLLNRTYKGKIKERFFADLDKDRKKEGYLVVEKEGTLEIHGIAHTLNGGKEITRMPGGRDGNGKVSSFSTDRNQVIEKRQMSGAGAVKTGGESRYNLVKRDEDLFLMPHGWQPFELENLLGQYTVENQKDSEYGKVLLIGEREGGKWKVDIQVRKVSNKEKVCHFKGLGEFVDLDLYVPLNQDNPGLKGSLKVSFLNGMATVYTEDHNDYMEMAEFCDGTGSIAGNYKK